ncbi:hypothetical protein NDU88_011548 [Pleurodeles waltl]|uniref:Uncharacterized protein n=1 Tax=Pleurodeles waltl TaxID=8319 RepID=A0AAV7QXK4_PLEWA|nr:hypothetical protein NDU88_011548 [Pleurodeles waltl]
MMQSEVPGVTAVSSRLVAADTADSASEPKPSVPLVVPDERGLSPPPPAKGGHRHRGSASLRLYFLLRGRYSSPPMSLRISASAAGSGHENFSLLLQLSDSDLRLRQPGFDGAQRQLHCRYPLHKATLVVPEQA